MSETPYLPTDRRPIASRRWPLWQRTASWLARRGVSPNGISVFGMIAAIVAGVAFAATPHLNGWERIAWFVAALGIQLRLLANLLDGMVAIESGRASLVGELYNEVPDRISDAAILIGAGYALGGDVAIGYLAALAAVFTAYVRVMGKAVGLQQDYCGPMAKQHRMAVMTLVAVYCGVTPASWQPLWGEAPARGLVSLALVLVFVGTVFTAVRRLSRIAANLRKGRS